MKNLILILLSVFLLIGFSATAAPPGEKKGSYLSISADVGWPQVEVGEIGIVNPLEAMLPVASSYQKRKFVSHNKKRNRWHRQTFGKSATEFKSASYIHIGKPVDPGLASEIWQWLASNVKDQS